MSKYNVGLKTLLLQGLSEPEFYGDLVYKFRKMIGKNDFSYHFKKIIARYKKIGRLQHSNFIAGRPKAALLFWFFSDIRCGVQLFIVILVIYKYKNRST